MSYHSELKKILPGKAKVYKILEDNGIPINGEIDERYQIFSNVLPNLTEQLRNDGFFDFHVTNTGWTYGLSQVLAFYKRNQGGWWLLHKGKVAEKTKIHVHHEDSNSGNNSEDNLSYVTPYLNLFIDFLVDVAIKSKSKAIKLAKNVLKGEEKIIALRSIEKSVRIYSPKLAKTNKTVSTLEMIKDSKITQEMLDLPEGEFTFIGKTEYLRKGMNIMKIVIAKVVPTLKRNWNGLSAKQMLKNLSKYGFTHKTYTPGYLNDKES